MQNLQTGRMAAFRSYALAMGAAGFVCSFIAAMALHPAFVMLWLSATFAMVLMFRRHHRWGRVLARIAEMHVPDRRRFTRRDRLQAVDVAFREIPAERAVEAR